MTQANRVNFNLNHTPLSPSNNNEDVVEVLSKKYRILYDLYVRRNRLERKLIILCVTLSLICFSILLWSAIMGIFVDKTICLEDNCVISAARLLESMNTSVDPCTDFYEYVCGNWPEEHVSSPGDSNTWFLEGTGRISDRILRILIAPSETDEIKPVLQARELYHMCLDTETLDNQGLEPLYRVLDALDLPRTIPDQISATDFNIAKTLALAQRIISADILITVSTIVDDETNKTVFHLSPAEGDSPFPDIWNSKRKKNHALSFKQIFVHQLSYVASIIAEIDSKETNATVIATAALRIIIIESQLRTDMEHLQNEDRKMTFAELQDLMNYTKIYDEDGNRENCMSAILSPLGSKDMKQLAKYKENTSAQKRNTKISVQC